MVGLGIHSLVGHNMQQVAEQIIDHLHLNPASYYPTIFISTVGMLTDTKLTFIVIGSIVYMIVRFIEAYGLWHELRWMEWFALVSAAIYIPFEIHELYLSVNLISISTISINIFVVFYISYVLFNSRKQVV